MTSAECTCEPMQSDLRLRGSCFSPSPSYCQVDSTQNGRLVLLTGRCSIRGLHQRESVVKLAKGLRPGFELVGYRQITRTWRNEIEWWSRRKGKSSDTNMGNKQKKVYKTEHSEKIKKPTLKRGLFSHSGTVHSGKWLYRKKSESKPGRNRATGGSFDRSMDRC